MIRSLVACGEADLLIEIAQPLTEGGSEPVHSATYCFVL